MAPGDLLKTVPFHLAFSAEDDSDALTNIILSEKLDKDATNLKELRTKGNLSSRYRFCFPGDSNTIPDDTKLGSYIASIDKNVKALQDAEKDKTVATLILSYRPNAAFKQESVESGLSTEPTDISEHDWNVVMLNNFLLHGIFFDPLFKLKRSIPDRYGSPAGTTPTSVGNPGQYHMTIDDSSVTFTSVRNSLQMSMVQNSFSSWSVEATASGGFAGFSGGAKASGGQSSEDLKKETMEKTIDVVHSSYKVRVFLGRDDLEVSEVCKEFLRTEGRGYDGAERFYSKFGTIFSTSVLLGGRLHSTVEASSCMKVTEQTTKEEKKAAVSTSFSSPFASGSAESSYVNATEYGQGHKKEDKSGRMNWEARGGTIFLATDPPFWISSVGKYQNWRVLERYGIEEKYIIQGPAVYLIAYDGRLLMRSPEGCHYNVRVNEATSLVDPNITQGGNAQWLLFKSESDREVTIIDPDRAKALLYDRVNDVVKAVEEPFSWNVWQASPGSDLLFLSCLDSAKKNWMALEVDTTQALTRF